MKRHKVEFTIIAEEGGEPEHIVREHDVVIYIDNEGHYSAIVFAPAKEGECPTEVWSYSGSSTHEGIARIVETYLRRDALDLVNVRVRVQEVDNG